MTVHKRFTSKKKNKIHWGYIVTIPSDKFDAVGNRKRKQIAKWGFETKKEALKAEKMFLDNLDKGKVELCKNATFNDVILFFLDYAENEGNYAKGTVANYKGLNNRYLIMLKQVRVDKLTPTLIRAWRKWLSQENTSYHTINNCIKLVKAAFGYAKKESQITLNPFEDLKKIAIAKKQRKRFTIEQLINMLSVCKENLPDFYCIFALACLTGMRVGEYSALNVSDINFESKEIYVEKQFTRGELKERTKTINSTRVVHPSIALLSIIKWHINKFDIKDGLLFQGQNKMPVSAKWVSRKFQKLLEICGFDKKFCRVHDLRGQYVDIMHFYGIPTEYIAREVGHSNTSTTSNIYTQILQDVSIKAHENIDLLLLKVDKK